MPPKKSIEEVEQEINNNIANRIIEPISPSVELIQRTENMKYLIWRAARVCYSIKSLPELEQEWGESPEEKKTGLVIGLIDRGHRTTYSHPTFSYVIVSSRVVSHQMVRHQVGVTIDQESQRYVPYETGFRYIEPEGVNRTDFKKLMEQAYDQYMTLYKDFRLKGFGKRESAELARYVLPSSISTRYVLTCSLAALIHLNHVRVKGATGRPQEETRVVCSEMSRLALEAEPWLKPVFLGKNEKETTEVKASSTKN
ncbi:MAG: FAD-dependent thymidylate synthase [Candidatus Melainabacteria bacterium]|nr:FAD-dependent thymidylate synthase [Candidatus Melainabacteria bacterium]